MYISMSNKTIKPEHIEPPSTAFSMTCRSGLYRRFMHFSHADGLDVQDNVRRLMAEYVERKEADELKTKKPL